MRALYIRFGIWFVILFGLGLWSHFLTHQWFQMTVLMVVYCADVLFNLGMVWYNQRLIRYSANVNQIERFLRRRRRNPFFGCLYAMVHRDYETARRLASQIRDPERRFECLASVALSENRWHETEALLSQVHDEEFKNFTRAVMALKLRDWGMFQTLKAIISDEESARILDVEEAYARGDFARAEQLAQQVIEQSRGLRKYIMVKGLEVNKEHPDRDTYF